MSHQTKAALSYNYLNWLRRHANEKAQVHSQFLSLRQSGLSQATSLIEMQINSFHQTPGELFSISDLREFAEGDITACLGQNYSVYEGRRTPRIPNGDLLLMNRILAIHGTPRVFSQKAAITSEYDVPSDAWYLPSDGEKTELPISISLEIALQPCGFLSAYLETPLLFPNEEYFFRNLAGKVSFTNKVDIRGKHIRTQAVLLETIISGTTIIQHFSFELLCDGLIFLKGHSSFGYFPAQTMANQVGLDLGEPSEPWFSSNMPIKNLQVVNKEKSSLLTDRLELIEQFELDPCGGLYQEGYIYGNRINSAADWYYSCHFFQDPVMPGSLGIEAIANLMKIFARTQEKTHPTISLAIDQEMSWKYRGQVLQKNKQVHAEVHFQKRMGDDGTRLLSGHANLWADNMRIYEIQNLTLALED